MKPFLLISFSLSCCLLALSAYAKDYPGYHQYSAGLLTIDAENSFHNIRIKCGEYASVYS
jgi:hypothetical protein